jgi:thiol-disulfide isomerase/thioredoxin
VKYVLLILALLFMIGCDTPTSAPPTLPTPPVPAMPDEPAAVQTVIGFTMLQCEPCKQMKPVWKKLNAKVYNVQRYPVLAQKYNITTCPTTILLRDGVEVKRVVGFQDF